MEQIFGNTKGARMMQGEKLTNFERIKSMSVDELAEFIENEDNLYEFCKKNIVMRMLRTEVARQLKQVKKVVV